MRRPWIILTCALLTVAACGGDQSSSQPEPGAEDTGTADAGDSGQVDASEDTGPGWVPDGQPDFPAVDGTTAIDDLDPDPNVVEVELEAVETTVELADGYSYEMYTYNGHLPGPIIQAKVGDRVVVHFTNRLFEPTTVHWHGLRISDEMDGSPRVQQPVAPGETFEYEFVVPDAGSYWYHPHVRSNEQIEKGLYGLLVVRGPDEPSYDRERYLTVDDMLLSDSGIPPFLQGHMESMHGRLGNVLLTNGQLDPLTLSAEKGDVERWRLVNPANARTMELSIEGASWRVIGTDGGLLPQPYETTRLVLPVGQRYDIEVTYEQAGPVVLNTHVLTRNEQNEVVEQAFELATVDVADSDRTPEAITWPDISLGVEDRQPTRDETITFEARQTNDGSIEWLLNGQAYPVLPLFRAAEGETVRIKLSNLAGPEHPFHLHGQFFTIVDDGREWTNQPGLKDTVLVPGQTDVEIIAYMDNPGRWMAHCHILEHAELGMMAEIRVDAAE